MEKFNVGIIGLGVGEQHLIGFLNSRLVNSISICDKDKKKIMKIKKKYPIERIYENAELMLKDKQIDIISIASYDDCHFNQIRLALENNKHVFCEKPICQNFNELNVIEKLLKKKKLTMTANTLLRYSPRFKSLKKKIEENYFGKIFYMELDYNYGRINKIYDGWRGKIKNYSVVLGGGVHMIDLLLWFKKSYPIKIKSFANNICTSSMKNHINDFVISLLKFKDSSIVKVCSNFGCVYPHMHRVMIYGSDKTFEQSYSSDFFLKKKKNGSIAKIEDSTDYPGIKKYDLISNFLKSINNKKKLLISQNEMFETMKLCLDINKSIKH